MFLRLLSLLALSCTIAAAADSAAGGIPNLSGNVGLTGERGVVHGVVSAR